MEPAHCPVESQGLCRLQPDTCPLRQTFPNSRCHQCGREYQQTPRNSRNRKLRTREAFHHGTQSRSTWEQRAQEGKRAPDFLLLRRSGRSPSRSSLLMSIPRNLPTQHPATLASGPLWSSPRAQPSPLSVLPASGGTWKGGQGQPPRPLSSSKQDNPRGWSGAVCKGELDSSVGFAEEQLSTQDTGPMSSTQDTGPMRCVRQAERNPNPSAAWLQFGVPWVTAAGMALRHARSSGGRQLKMPKSRLGRPILGTLCFSLKFLFCLPRSLLRTCLKGSATWERGNRSPKAQHRGHWQ